MEALSVAEVARIVGAAAPTTNGERRVLRVTTDSRDVRSGDLFVALPGARTDGHVHVAAALAAGAAAALVSQRPGDAEPCLCVPDTRRALGALAVAVRAQVTQAGRTLVVGITGTNGKTTVKDLTAAVLSPLGSVVASRRSFNNSLGVPLTLLELTASTAAAVLELGTSAPGEIAALTALVAPEIGIITNVGPGHLAGLGTVAGVAQEKGALLAGLVGRRVSLLNRDDPNHVELLARAPGPVLFFGTHKEADVRAEAVRCDAEGTRFLLGGGRHEVRIALLGRHAVGNALAALACALVAGVDTDAAIAALAAVRAPPGRLQLRRCGELQVLDDTYNANPASVAAALAAVREARLPGRFIAVLGDMLELGEASAELHARAGAAAAAADPALLVAVGQHADSLVAGARAAGLPAARCRAVSTRDEAATLLADWLRPGDLVLLKASRGMALESLLTDLGDCRAGAA